MKRCTNFLFGPGKGDQNRTGLENIFLSCLTVYFFKNIFMAIDRVKFSAVDKKALFVTIFQFVLQECKFDESKAAVVTNFVFILLFVNSGFMAALQMETCRITPS